MPNEYFSRDHKAAGSRSLLEGAVSRRALFATSAAAAGAAFLSGQLADFNKPAAAATAVDALRAAAAVYIDFDKRMASRRGASVGFTDAAPGAPTGRVRAASANKLAPALPFTGASVSANKLPVGLEWHSTAAPKVLLSVSDNALRYRGNTTSALPLYFGGVRTAFDVVAPGQSILFGFRASMPKLTGHPAATIRVGLLRISDGKTTLLSRAYNYQEGSAEYVKIRLNAPAGGTGGYRLVVTVEAGESRAGQQVEVELSQMVVVDLPAEPSIGYRHAIPPYFAKTLGRQGLVVAPKASPGAYHVIVRTDEFGWAAENIDIQSASSTVNVGTLFGSGANFTVRELYVTAASTWRDGGLAALAGTATWLPLKFMNLGSSEKARPQTINRLSRLTGLPTSVSTALGDDNGGIPSLAAPESTWSASFSPERLSYSSFIADQTRYIRDSGSTAGVRSEVLVGESVPFGRDEYVSFWVRCLTTLQDNIGDRLAVLFQYRYINNTSNDSSRLSPDLALEQLPGNRFRFAFRSDAGKPVLSGGPVPAGIQTAFVGPFPHVVGKWYPVTVKTRFSNTGGGYLKIWFDRKVVFDGPAAVGYNRNVGPRLHYGSYKFSDSVSKVEFQHFEQGARDLSGRGMRPLPI